MWTFLLWRFERQNLSTRLGKVHFSIEEILNSLHHIGSPEASEAFWRLEQEKKGDFSAQIQTLREGIEGWEKLPENAQNSLIEGQRRITGPPQADYAPDIVSFAKGIEITLSTVVFDAFREHCRQLPQLSELLNDGLQEKYKKAHALILYLKNKQHLELGKMTFALQLSTGKTARKLFILGCFNEFICHELKLGQVLEQKFLTNCDKLARIRNPAAHEKTFGIAEAQAVRENAIGLLNQLV
jgi:hypothetical protein